MDRSTDDDCGGSPGGIGAGKDAGAPSESAPAIVASWPRKVRLFGVDISVTDYDELCHAVFASCQSDRPAVVSCYAVHGLVTSGRDDQLRDAVNRFQAVTPDGQPIRWGLNRFYGCDLKDRVYGPELMLRLCRGAAERGLPIYLYGSTEAVLDQLSRRLVERFPELVIAGTHAPPFRALTADEDAAVVEAMHNSGAKLVFIGLGFPKQDQFAAEHRHSIRAVQVCVGAAFDFHAGHKATAPAWMQRLSLEWLFRLCHEPRRLWRRYLVTNALFSIDAALAILRITPPAGGRRHGAGKRRR